jgi:tetratricopeptide (TPR) repeat protein
LALLRILRWPQLLIAAGLAVLAAASVRGLAVLVGRLLPAWAMAGEPPTRDVLLLVDPIDWVFLIASVVLGVRACRLFRRAPPILPWEAQAVPPARRVCARALLALTVLYSLVLVTFAGISRSELSPHLLQPGVAMGREFQALLARIEADAPTYEREWYLDEQSVRLFAELEKKDRTAERKFEEARVHARQGGIEAESLLQEAIRLWEEILPHATNPSYRKEAVARFLFVYLLVGELQQHAGKRPEAEATFGQAIAYGEKALTLISDRPIIRRVLEEARQRLVALREHAFDEEFGRLCATQRFDDAVDLCLRHIEKQEERVESGVARNAARRHLAYRLDRYARLLTHCPDSHVHDPKIAVKRAQRATQLQPEVGEYWYTLALAQYRHGDWRGSLQSLAIVEAKVGGFDATDWFLTAMNLHRLNRWAEARDARQKAVDWIANQTREAEGDALLRSQLESQRPAIEALQREADDLMEGRDPADRGVGSITTRGAVVIALALGPAVAARAVEGAPFEAKPRLAVKDQACKIQPDVQVLYKAHLDVDSSPPEELNASQEDRGRRQQLALAEAAELLETKGQSTASEKPERQVPTVDALQIKRLILQLGSDDFTQREAASKRLEAIGEPAWNSVRKAATSSADAEIRHRAKRLADAIGGRLYGEIRRFEKHTDGVYAAAFSPDGRRVLSGAGWGTSNDPIVRYWVAETGEETRQLVGHSRGIMSLAFSADGKRALSGSQDKTMRLWDLETGKELKRFEGHEDSVMAVALSPNGKLAVSSGWDKTLRLWDVETAGKWCQIIFRISCGRTMI